MASYCISPLCSQRQNPDDAERCLACGTSLLLNNRIRLVKPLRPLDEDSFSYFDVFEVDDAGTKWNPVREQRVLKVLKWSEPKLVELIRREALALQLIKHPCIPKATIDDYFSVTPHNSHLELHCLVMQRFEGETLQEWIKSSGRIPQSLALNWLKQLVEILDVVHTSGFFHRDIKPDNIIFQPDGQLALIDFGGIRRVTNTYLAKVSGSGGISTGIGSGYEITAVRTARYSPLEQINGQAVPQSDFYALGRTFVHLVTGYPLLKLKTDEKTGRLIWRNKAPQIDKPLADFLDELMAPFPGQRPQTTRVILQRLERIPFQVKLNRIANSNLLKVGGFGLLVLLLFGTYKVSLPLFANYYFEQGKKADQENYPEIALKDFQLATKFNPVTALSISGYYFEQASRSKEHLEIAKKYYELAIKFNPDDTDAYNNLALACQSLDDFSCAITNYEKAISRKPKNWVGYYNLGTFHDEQGDYTAAEEHYKAAKQPDGNIAVMAINNLSRLNNLKGNYTDAVKYARKGLSRLNEVGNERDIQASLNKNLGWARLGQRRHEDARSLLEKARDLDYSRAETHCLLAQTQEALKDSQGATISWDNCLRITSELPEVAQWRTAVLKRLLPAAYKNYIK